MKRDLSTIGVHASDPDLLESDVRTRVLERLYRAGGAVPLESLADQLVTDPDVPVAHPEPARRALDREHLPQLAAAGIVEYDRDRGLARLGT